MILYGSTCFLSKTRTFAGSVAYFQTQPEENIWVHCHELTGNRLRHFVGSLRWQGMDVTDIMFLIYHDYTYYTTVGILFGYLGIGGDMSRLTYSKMMVYIT